MRAMVITRTGGPEVLELQEVPDPVPSPHEVLIEVRATALNRADILKRNGKYSGGTVPGEVPGLEVSGRIAQLGSDVTGWSVGDAVCALTAGGAYAEKVAIPGAQLMHIPEGLSFEDAAAIPEAFTTAFDNLLIRGQLQQQESALIHGGSSGVGTAAIQLARSMDVRVMVTAGSQAKLDRCAALGAEVLINYQTQDFVEVVKEETDGRGVDALLDHIGGPYLERNLASLSVDGRLVVIGTMGGKTATIDLAALMTGRNVITGSRLRNRSIAEKAALAAELQSRFWPAFENRTLVPVVDRALPWEEAAAAHSVMEESTHIGKIVLQVSRD